MKQKGKVLTLMQKYNKLSSDASSLMEIAFYEINTRDENPLLEMHWCDKPKQKVIYYQY